MNDVQCTIRVHAHIEKSVLASSIRGLRCGCLRDKLRAVASWARECTYELHEHEDVCVTLDLDFLGSTVRSIPISSPSLLNET